ncbi:MAG: radical SAM protein [Anaerolineae bacterium]
MVKSVHFLLTLACTSACDHCFLWCSPRAGGTFTVGTLRRALEQIGRAPTVTGVCFEGGEPFLYYALLLEGVRLAAQRGLGPGAVSNAYWATSVEDARLWLKPLREAGLASLSLSDDALHRGEGDAGPATYAREAAEALGLRVGILAVERPQVEPEGNGLRLVAGGIMFRGRAAEVLAPGLPVTPWEAFDRCPHENLTEPERVHLDAFGNVHLCQGLLMGNAWREDLGDLFAGYQAHAHAICGPLLRGGPAELVRAHDLPHAAGYVDACHLCYEARKALLERRPELLAPRQVYGLA